MATPTPVFLPGKSHGQRRQVGYSPWGCKKSGMTEDTDTTHTHTHADLSQGQAANHSCNGVGPLSVQAESVHFVLNSIFCKEQCFSAKKKTKQINKDCLSFQNMDKEKQGGVEGFANESQVSAQKVKSY